MSCLPLSQFELALRRAGSLARKLRQALLVFLHRLHLLLALQVLLGWNQEERYLATLGARAADVLLRSLTLAPFAEAFCRIFV